MTNSHQISDNLFLVQQPVNTKAPTKKVETPLNHIVVIDCSGSMAGDLPQIRDQLKKKLPKLLSEKDTLSVVWFSGRDECGILLEAEPVATLKDLQQVNSAIDRWLRPVGMTGFKDPFEKVSELVARVGGTCSLIFMSDGCDNQTSDRNAILKAVETASGGLASSTFVEYGYYADRQLLTSMAQKSGGSLIFARDFAQYAPQIEQILTRKVNGAPRIEVDIKGDAICGFAYVVSDDDVVAYEIRDGRIQVPVDTKFVSYLSPKSIGNAGSLVLDASRHGNGNQSVPSEDDLRVVSTAYAAVSLYSVRMKPNVIYPILRSLGDVALITGFNSCFGKQRYSDFMEESKKLALHDEGRFAKGWDPTKVPNDDAFTILDLLRILSQDEENRVLLDHPSFKYSRIGRARVDAGEQLSAKESEELQSLTEALGKTKKVAEIQALTAQIAVLTAKKLPGLRFVEDPAPAGYSISNLVFNEARPNVSIQVKKPGKVDISDRIPENLKTVLPSVFQTHIVRNYTVIKDGLVNVSKLPLRVSADTLKILQAEVPTEAVLEGDELGIIILDLDKLPIINRKMTKSVSAKSFFDKKFSLLTLQASQKVLNSLIKELPDQTKDDSLALKYGSEASVWLSEHGFRDYGFSPKTVQAESTDVYQAKELKSSIKGYSTLPSLKDLRDAVIKNKVNPPGLLMKTALDQFSTFLAQHDAEENRKFLENHLHLVRNQVRDLIFELAQTTFILIVGQIWPTEFSSLEENSITVSLSGKDVLCTMTLSEYEERV